MSDFGRVIEDVDLSTVDEERADWLRETVSAHGVVVFRNQRLDDVGFVRVMRLLGRLVFTPGETPVEGAPDLNVVSNVGRTTPPRSVWHTDSSYFERPPAFTGLRAVTVPERGGATLFTDQYDAAERLGEERRRKLAGRNVRHRVSGLEGQKGESRHPLLRRHPVTGRTALFLSTPERCDDVDGMASEDARTLIAELYAMSTDEEASTFRHLWRPGDVVIWDDRSTLHRADHSDTVGDRVMHRGMVEGETPIAA